MSDLDRKHSKGN